MFIESPLSVALTSRALSRWALGRHGWREDFKRAVEMARRTDPMSQAVAVNFQYGPSIPCGVLLSNDTALGEIEEALSITEQSSDDIALGNARMAKGLALVHRQAREDRAHGVEILMQVRDMCLHERFSISEFPVVELYAARARARDGDIDSAVPVMRPALDVLFHREQFAWCVPATSAFVETLLCRGTSGDLEEAEEAIQRLAAVSLDPEYVMREVFMLRLRALLCRARGNDVAYRDFADRYCAMANALGFEGHMAWALELT